VADTPPVSALVDDAGVEHRLWMRAVGEDEARDAQLAAVAERLGAGAITLADGHHRYETALRYADDRRRGPAVEERPAWAEILMLILEPTEGPLTVPRAARAAGGLRPPDAPARRGAVRGGAGRERGAGRGRLRRLR
jgi:hypothetical protein